MELSNHPLIDEAQHLSEYILPNYIIYKDLENEEYYEHLNSEQIEFFKELKAHYFKIILAVLINSQGMGLTETLQEVVNEKISNLSDYYFSSLFKLLDLLILGWSEVKCVFTNMDLNIVETFTRLALNAQADEKCPKLSLEEPKMAFLFILRSNAIYQFCQCLSFDTRLYTQTLYRDSKNFLKIEAKKITSEPLSTQEEKTIKRAQARFRTREIKDESIGNFLKDCCLKIWSESKDKTIKMKLKYYLESTEDLNNEVIKPYHPRKNPQPIGWLNGKKIG